MTDEKIIGLYKIDQWIREELRKPENSHVCEIEKLGYNDRFVKLLPFNRSNKAIFGDRFSDLIPDDDFEDDFPLVIDAMALQVLVSSFVKQQSEDQRFPEISAYYQRMAEQCKNHLFSDREEEIYPSPNALAILLYGIMEFGVGLNEKQENEFYGAIKGAIVTAGKLYVWPTYYENSSRNKSERSRYLVIDDVEITIPAKKTVPDSITGINKIEAAIFRHLKALGKKGFISSAHLTALEPDASQAREAWGSEQPLVPVNQSRPKQWAIGKPTLEALTDRFAKQLQNDQQAHGDLFADQIYSPSAQALLLHGIKYATCDILGEQDEGLGMEIIRQAVLEATITDEARNYAKCILFNLTPAEVRRENDEALRPTYQPALADRRVRGSNL